MREAAKVHTFVGSSNSSLEPPYISFMVLNLTFVIPSNNNSSTWPPVLMYAHFKNKNPLFIDFLKIQQRTQNYESWNERCVCMLFLPCIPYCLKMASIFFYYIYIFFSLLGCFLLELFVCVCVCARVCVCCIWPGALHVRKIANKIASRNRPIRTIEIFARWKKMNERE